jgi:hypothetical protein
MTSPEVVVVGAGANACLSEAHVLAAGGVVRSARAVLLSLEIPVEAATAAAREAAR